MKKKYFYILLLFGFLLTVNISYAQYSTEKPNIDITQNIDGLSIYPNPVINGKVFISTKLNLTKEVNIYDVLGKKIISQTLFGEELNISNLTPGVYILRIKEHEFSATRKLVVR